MDNASLANLTYGQAENYYHRGHITQDQWDGYVTGWRRSAPRMSSLGASMACPQSPEIEAIAAEIAAAALARKAR